MSHTNIFDGDQRSILEVLDSTKRNDADFEALKTALQAVHPFVPSIFQSEYYFISPKVLLQGATSLGVFALVLKTFSNKLVKDAAQIYSIAYEIECKLVHRQSQEPVEVVFGVFDFNLKQGLQAIQVTHANQIDGQLSKLQIAGNTIEPQFIKDILTAHFNLNQDGKTETNFQLLSVVLDKELQLQRLGAYDVYFTIRNRMVAQTQIYVIPKFNTSPESLVKMNQGLKLNQFQAGQRVSIRYQFLVEAAQAPVALELQLMNQLQDFALQAPNPVKAKEPSQRKKSAKNQEDSAEFSYDDAQPRQEQRQEQQAAKPTSMSFIWKLFKPDQVDDLNQLNIQSSKTRKQVQIVTQHQYDSKPVVTEYCQQNLKNNQLQLINLLVAGGEQMIFFQYNLEQQIVQVGQQGVQITKEGLRFNAKHFVFSLKLIMTRKTVDVYQDAEFLGSYEYDGIYVKLLEKGASIEVVDGGDL